MIRSQLFDDINPNKFEDLALQIFHYQSVKNKIYSEYLNFLKVNPDSIQQIEKIPFLPIQFFKNRKVVTSKNIVEQVFLSSGTTDSVQSKHYVTDIEIYKKSYIKGFKHFYGNIQDHIILALLPNYLERNGSSLIFMIDDLIKKTNSSESGYYLGNMEELSRKLVRLDQKNKKVLLIGVSFALLDLIEYQKFELKNTIIMETGGMKGRRKEMIREELHKTLCEGFGVSKIHSEYGMTELLSQAYSFGMGIFKTPPWMRVLIRDSEDALVLLPHRKAGGLNIIDFANVNSCSFIATQDLGKTYQNGTFEILGRFDNSDIRGCNLMVV